MWLSQFEGAERGDVDLRAAGEGGAQGHRRVHGADRDADVADDQQPQPGAEQDDGDQAERRGSRGAAGGRARRRVRAGRVGPASGGRGARVRRSGAVMRRACGGGGAGRGPLVPYAQECRGMRIMRGVAGVPCAVGRSGDRTMGRCWR